MIENKKINQFKPMIISKYTYIDMQNDIERLERDIHHQRNLTAAANRDSEQSRKEYDQLFKLKEKEQRKMESIIQKKNKEIDSLTNEKDKLNKKVTQKSNTLKDYETQIKALTRRVNYLESQLNAKDLALDENKKSIEELEVRNKIQADKIRAFASNTEHLPEEYKGDGLPKQTKKALKKNKKEKEKENESND